MLRLNPLFLFIRIRALIPRIKKIFLLAKIQFDFLKKNINTDYIHFKEGERDEKK